MKIAHKKEGIEQNLIDHIFNVADYSFKIGDQIDLGKFSWVIGFCHDLGKADSKWQEYINGSSKKRVNHSSAGARYFEKKANVIFTEKNIESKLFIEIGTYVILSHHGLFNCIDESSCIDKVSDRLNYDSTDTSYNYSEVEKYADEILEKRSINLEAKFKEAFSEFCLIYEKVRKLSEISGDFKISINFYISATVRMLLSILKESDIYDSRNAFFEIKEKIYDDVEIESTWDNISVNIINRYKSYRDNNTKLGNLRTEISDKLSEKALEHPNGIIELSLPTGSGKTESSFRFAVNNAKMHSKKRIFYITAYLSVLEQNAASLKSIINNDAITLEHHSNVFNSEVIMKQEGESEEEYEIYSALTESWESPIIFTTMVQFFNTMFKHRSAQIRRFCKLSNSVIIIDEVQSIPPKTIYLFNLMNNFMSEIMKCTILHCSATPPKLFSKNLDYKIELKDSIFRDGTTGVFDRVNYITQQKSLNETIGIEDLFDEIFELLSSKLSCLIVFNTKNAVKQAYDYLKENIDNNAEFVYLSTNLCAQHRIDQINVIKSILNNNRMSEEKKKIIVVSTQLVEAGVDLDFDIVARSLAGIENIIQVAGRCNREGKLKIDNTNQKGLVYIFNPNFENLDKLEDIRNRKNSLISVIPKCIDSNCINNISNCLSDYYENFYANNKDGLNTVELLLLSTNNEIRNGFRKKNSKNFQRILSQSFLQAATQFSYIEETDSIGVIVPYNNLSLLNEIEKLIESKDYNNLKIKLREAQRFMVNLRSSDIKAGSVIKIIEGVYFLSSGNYDPNVGYMKENEFIYI